MPPPGKRAAAWSWNSDAFKKALEEVPSAFFSLFHQIFPSPSGQWAFAKLQLFRWSLGHSPPIFSNFYPLTPLPGQSVGC
jgi:hypothetical protein